MEKADMINKTRLKPHEKMKELKEIAKKVDVSLTDSDLLKIEKEFEITMADILEVPVINVKGSITLYNGKVSWNLTDSHLFSPINKKDYALVYYQDRDSRLVDNFISNLENQAKCLGINLNHCKKKISYDLRSPNFEKVGVTQNNQLY